MEKFLPAEIKLDIFSRLPAESVLQCGQVCKTWRTLLHDPCFAHMHLHRSQQLDDRSNNNYSNGFVSAKVGFLMLIELIDKSNWTNQLCYQEYHENEERSYKPLTRINHPLVGSSFDIVGSCNGLICLYSFYYNCHQNIYICNPITREYVILPRLDVHSFMAEGYPTPTGRILRGFGYIPSTNEYKVVKIYFRDNYHYSGQLEINEVYALVYTLGSGTGLRKMKYSLLIRVEYALKIWGVLANGALHWKDSRGKIMYFDLGDEELRLLPLPPYEDANHEHMTLEVLGGRLCLVYLNPQYDGIDIWSYNKQNKSSTTNDMDVQEYQSWCWSMEFSIPLIDIDGDDFNQPLAFTQSGEVLMWFFHEKIDDVSILTRYDPKTKTLIKLDLGFLFNKRAIPHVNSFVSLKSLGEDAKTIGPAEEILTRRKVAFPKKRRKVAT